MCVTELDSPSHMNVFVSECVLHSLEKSSNHRKYAGELLECLYAKNTILTKDNIDLGLVMKRDDNIALARTSQTCIDCVFEA